MGVINKEGSLYMATGIDNSGLKQDAAEAEKIIDDIGKKSEEVGAKMQESFDIGTDSSKAFVEELNKTGKSVQSILDEIEASRHNMSKLFEFNPDLSGFDAVKQQLEIQKKVISELEDQYEKAKSVFDSVNISTNDPVIIAEREKASKLFQEIRAELEGEKQGLIELEKEYSNLAKEEEKRAKQKETAANKQITTLTQMKQIAEEMRSLRGTDGIVSPENIQRYEELKKKLSEIGTSYRIVQQEQKALTTAGSADLAGLVQGITGVAGAFSAAQGVASLFTKDNEKLAAIQTKLQAAMSITIGLQQVSNTLHVTSAFRMNIASKATLMWRSSINKLSVALGISNIQAQILMATLTVGLSLAITGVVILLERYNSEQDKAIAKNKKFAEAVGSNISSLRSNYEKLRKEWAAANGDIQKQEELLLKNGDAYNSLGVKIRDVNEANNIFVENTGNFIKSLELRAKAAASMELASEKYKEAIQKMLEAEGNSPTPSLIDWFSPIASGKKLFDVFGHTQLKVDAEKAEEEAREYILKSIGFSDENVALMNQMGLKATEDISENSKAWYQKIRDNQQKVMDESLPGSKKFNTAKKERDAAAKMLEQWDKTNTKQIDSRAQKMRDAQLKLSNLQSELDSQAIQQQLDHEQKLLDIEQDSFDKRYRQNQLNTAKEFVAIEEYRQKMAKAQQDAAKSIYVSKNGTEKGFDYSSFDKSLLPNGLKDSDIEAHVQQMSSVIVAAYKKGNDDISRELKAFADEENLTFASQLDQQIYSIRAHYKQRRIEATNNADLLKQINENENKEVIAARLQAHQKQLESDADYNQKYLQLVEDRYVFESDKQKASLEQQIKDQKKIFNDLEKQVLNDPNNSELANQLRDAYIQLRILNKELAKTPNQKFAEKAGYVNEVVSSLSQLDGLEDLDKLSSFISSGAQFATGDYIGGGLSAFSGIVGLITSASQEKERQAKIQREINKLQQQYNIDLRQQNVDLISSIDYVRVFRDNLEALQWLVEKGFISNVDYSAWDALNTQFKVLKDNISAAQSEYDKYSNQGNDFINNLSRFSMLNSTIRKAVDELNKGIAAGDKNATLNALEILASSDNTWSDKAKDLADQLSKAGSEVTDLTSQMAELSQQMDEFATGTSFDSFLSDAANAIKDLRGDISGLADFTEEKLTNAILSSFKYQVLSNALKPMYDELSDMFLSGDFDSSKANDWKQRLTDILKTNGEELDKIFDAFGVDPDTADTKASSKGIVSMSQDSANELNGNFFALLQKTGDISNINEASRLLLGGINNGVSDIQTIMRENNKVFQDSLKVQIKIEQNTFRAAELLNKFDTTGITIRN